MSLRDEMPTTAAFVDAMRDAFGRGEVNAWVLGKNGGQMWASENGREYGERLELGTRSITADAFIRLGKLNLKQEGKP